MRPLLLVLVCVALCPAVFVAQDNAKRPPVPAGPPDPAFGVVGPTDVDSICDANLADQLLNCGFETGDATSWVSSNLQGLTGVADYAANSGSFGVYSGNVGSSDVLYSSPVYTSPAQQYHAEFWLANEVGGTGTFADVLWAGTEITACSADGKCTPLQDAPQFDWTLFTAGPLPPGSDPTQPIYLHFEFQQDPDFWWLDDVDVEPISTDGSPIAARQSTHGIPRVVARGPFAPGAAGGHLARRPAQVNGFAGFGFRSPAETLRSFVQKVKHPIAPHPTSRFRPSTIRASSATQQGQSRRND
jgi:hypothetical protein